MLADGCNADRVIPHSTVEGFPSLLNLTPINLATKVEGDIP
jgi:hypothetical protein